MSVGSLIDKLFEQSNHGTRREDVVAIWNAAIIEALSAIEAVVGYDELDPAITFNEAVERLKVQP